MFGLNGFQLMPRLVMLSFTRRLEGDLQGLRADDEGRPGIEGHFLVNCSKLQYTPQQNSRKRNFRTHAKPVRTGA